MAKKDRIKPLNEDEYDNIETHELYAGDGFPNEMDMNISNMEFNENYSPNDQEAPIKVFTFNSDSDSEDNKTNTNTYIESGNDFSRISSQDNNPKTNDDINQNSKSMNLPNTQVRKVRGLTPSIDDEAFDIKRCYQFRSSTLKKLNQLKGESDNINIYLNEIIDAAICFYHDAVFNKK